MFGLLSMFEFSRSFSNTSVFAAMHNTNAIKCERLCAFSSLQKSNQKNGHGCEVHRTDEAGLESCNK